MRQKKKDLLLGLFFVGLFALILSETKIIPPRKSAKKSSQLSESSGASGDSMGDGQEKSQGTTPALRTTSASRVTLLADALSTMQEQLTIASAPIPLAQRMKARTTDFFDKDGNFKSYYEEGVPEEFLSDRNHFTTPEKMQRDLERRLEKLQYDMEMEEEVFTSTFGREGKYEEEYNRLRALHRKISRQAYEQNMKALREFRIEIEKEDEKGLR